VFGFEPVADRGSVHGFGGFERVHVHVRR
jgi:hypothetical protein